MPEMHLRKLPIVDARFDDGRPDEVIVEVYVCDDCGAIVGHTAEHNLWHERLRLRTGLVGVQQSSTHDERAEGTNDG